MEELEKLRQWLVTFPKWETGGPLYIDFTDGQPGSAGLYPQGMEEVRRVTDITGTVTVCCRWNFVLYRMTQLQEDNEADAGWLMAFQQWVQQQCAAGLAPVFGDEPSQERICAQKGRLLKANEAGTVRYSVELTVEFVKHQIDTRRK